MCSGQGRLWSRWPGPDKPACWAGLVVGRCDSLAGRCSLLCSGGTEAWLGGRHWQVEQRVLALLSQWRTPLGPSWELPRPGQCGVWGCGHCKGFRRGHQDDI